MFGRLKDLMPEGSGSKARSATDTEGSEDSRQVGQQSSQEAQHQGRRRSSATAVAAGSLNRDQLLHRLQVLTDKNERFELRFRDVVAAYKSLLKEKQALELTVRALTGSESATSQGTATPTTAAVGETSEEGKPEQGRDAEETKAEDEEQKEGHEESGDVQQEQEQQHAEGEASSETGEVQRETSLGADATTSSSQHDTLAALKEAIQTLTQENATLTARFQQDKRITAENHRTELEQVHAKFEKALSQEQERNQELSDKCSRLETQVESLTQQLSLAHTSVEEKDSKIKELRETHEAEVQRVREEMETPDTDVQKRLLELNDKLQGARDAEIDAITKLNDESARNRERELQLEQELSRLKARAASAEYRGESKAMLKLKAELVSLQKEVERWKEAAEAAQQSKDQALMAAQQQMQEAQQTAEFATQQQQQSLQLENREKEMQEKRIVELSNMISRYEHSRLEDQKKIDSLREGLSDYKDQVYALRETVKELQDALDEDDKVVIAKLQDTISRLKSRLHHALNAQHSDQAEEEEGEGAVRQPSWMTDGDASSATDTEADADLQARLESARQEAMAYYKRAKNLSQQNNELNRQVAILTRQRDKLDAALRTKTEQQRAALQEACERWETEKDAVRQELEAEIGRVKAEHRKAMEDMHIKQQRTRQRQMALLSDKDAEIARLRASAPVSPGPPVIEPQHKHAKGHQPVSAQKDTLKTADPLLHINNLEADHLNQREVARRRERELVNKCIQLEEANASLQTKLNHLQEEVRRFERNARREGANLEYLKNIVFKYMITDMGRDRMAKAIAAVLQFSPEEERRALAACRPPPQASWLW